MPLTASPFRADLYPLVPTIALVLMCGAAQAASLTWIGGTADWVNDSGTANWTSSDEPDADDTAIFNTTNVVTLGSNNSIAGLTMSTGIDLLTADFDLTVNGLVQLVDASTILNIGGAESSLTADSMTINAGGVVELSGGSLTLDEESGNSLLDMNVGSFLQGNGTVSFTDALAAVTTEWVNDGTLTALSRPQLLLSPPPVGTLLITASDVDTRLDLDGIGEAGAVNVNRNQTLDIDVGVADIFNGGLSMSQNTKLDIAGSWILGANATVDIDNGAAGGFPGIAAGTAIIAGGSFSQNDGTITVVDADGILQFDAPFSFNGGLLTNNGHVIFNQTAVIAALANLNMVGDSDLTVEDNRTVTINQTAFNFDGSGAGGTAITVNNQGTLILNVTDYDSDSVTNGFDGTVNLNDGDISVTSGDAEFVMDGTLNMSSTVNGEIVVWGGEPLDIGNDAGSLDADLNVSGTRQSQLSGQVDFNSDADVNVAAGATLAMLGVVDFNTVNVGNAEFTGTGTFAFSGAVNVNEAVTLNMTGGTVDLDGLDNTGDTVNIDAPMTINAATMSAFGRANGGGGVNTLDINNSVGLGTLTVNLDSAAVEWTLNSQGVMNLVNDNTEATLLAGNAINLNGTVSVTGDVRSTARLDFGSTAAVNIITAGQPLRLGGGNGAPDFNTISGATISGAGQLGADTGKRLQGYGTINADLAFVGTANLYASGGTLTLGGDIVDVNILGTADNTGILNIPNPWESDGGAGGSIGAVVLGGGVLQGGVITNDNATGLQGHGTITSRVINTSRIVATNGGTLTVQTVGNDNDWDGAANLGELEALSANLDLVDTTMPAPPVRQFGGKVRAINDNRVYCKGFALDFNPGSSLTLEDEATFRADSSTDLGSTVTVVAGSDATIQVENNFFLTFQNGSTTTLNGDLTVRNNNINIKAGATFSGTGALTVPDVSHAVLDGGSNVNVLFQMQGAFRPANFNGIGQVTVKDYQSAPTTELYVELIGTALNQYDRITVNGVAEIDGYLNVDIDEISPGVPFVPALGNKFNIISASGGVVGRFDALDTSGMPAGLTFKINYLPTIVQLEVIAGYEFETWINLFEISNPSDLLRTADPDKDGLNNLVEFGLDGDPTSGKPNPKVVIKIAPVGGVNALTMTFPARAPLFTYDTPDGEFVVRGLAATPNLWYRAQASDTLVTFPLQVDQVTGPDATALQAGLPMLNPSWLYASFRSPGPVAGDPKEFMRVDVSELAPPP